jgi:hypothetical protein
LALVMLAGIGIDLLRRVRSRPAMTACIALIVVVMGEYSVQPSAMSRDVLPTAAHRWLVDGGPHTRALDCAPITLESESVGWLTRGRITLAGAAIESCAGPQLPALLAANGFTHVIERGTFKGLSLAQDGLAIAARFDNGTIYAVTARPPAVYTAATVGFEPREHDATWSWRGIGDDASLIVVNISGVAMPAVLHIELAAFQRPRELEFHVDGARVHTVLVQPGPQWYEIGPIGILPGSHQVVFHSVDAPTIATAAVAANARVQRSFAVGNVEWRAEGQR